MGNQLTVIVSIRLSFSDNLFKMRTMGPPENGAGARHGASLARIEITSNQAPEILDKMLEEDRRLVENTRKMLVIGARGSGKARIFAYT